MYIKCGFVSWPQKWRKKPFAHGRWC